MTPTRLGIYGVGGRLGQRIEQAAADHAGFELVARIGRHGIADFSACDVVIDVAVAAATERLVRALAGTSAALVTGVTGRSGPQQAALTDLAAARPVFEASNFSVGVAVLSDLVTRAARALGPAFDAEIFELHHRHKADAPSGTALTLGEAVAQGRDLAWPAARAAVRDGLTGPRPAHEVGIAAARAGDVIGEHTVYFCGPSERVELVHRAHDRGVFAHGALRAAQWVVGRAPGRYAMTDLVQSIAP